MVANDGGSSAIGRFVSTNGVNFYRPPEDKNTPFHVGGLYTQLKSPSLEVLGEKRFRITYGLADRYSYCSLTRINAGVPAMCARAVVSATFTDE